MIQLPRHLPVNSVLWIICHESSDFNDSSKLKTIHKQHAASEKIFVVVTETNERSDVLHSPIMLRVCERKENIKNMRKNIEFHLIATDTICNRFFPHISQIEPRGRKQKLREREIWLPWKKVQNNGKSTACVDEDVLSVMSIERHKTKHPNESWMDEYWGEESGCCGRKGNNPWRTLFYLQHYSF